ncbi:MAG: hypothetical protein HKN20_06090 [Gemmatimonadetes bacterium]|nr:hypothetical protein [Gemmatimonadota bacterium]
MRRTLPNRYHLAAALVAIILLGCTRVEYTRIYDEGQGSEGRTTPIVSSRPELAVRLDGYVDMGEILARGQGARAQIMREASRKGADLVYISYYTNTPSAFQESDQGLASEKDETPATYFEAKLFRHEPDIAMDRGLIFALAYPSELGDASGRLVTADDRALYVAAFLDSGANPNAEHGGVPVLGKVITHWHRHFDGRHVDIVRSLVAHGADPGLELPTGETLLQACERVEAWVLEKEESAEGKAADEYSRMREQYGLIREALTEATTKS